MCMAVQLSFSNALAWWWGVFPLPRGKKKKKKQYLDADNVTPLGVLFPECQRPI